MKNNFKLIIPVAILLLAACGGNSTPSTHPETSDNSNSNLTSEITPNPSETSEEIPSETTQVPSSETSSEPIPSETTTEEVPSESSSEEKPSESTSEEQPPVDKEIPAQKDRLDCGSYSTTGPKNSANPLDINNWQNFNTKEYMPDNFSYLYGNNKTNPKMYADKNGGIKIDDPRKGFQTPVFKSFPKVEFNLKLIGHPKDKKTQPNKDADQLHIYLYDINAHLIETIKIQKFDVNASNKERLELKLDIKNPECRYLEFRMNNFPYDSSSQCYNLAVTEVSLKGWNFQ